MQDLLRLQRETIDRHIRAENSHDWATVYETFVQDESVAFYDVVPLHARFPGLTVVKGFYQAAQVAFPDFRIEVWSESDAPGCSLREVTISGTHKGSWCGVEGTGRQVLQQINGTLEISAIPSFTRATVA